MRVGIPAETTPGERRVAVAPDTVPRLLELGLDVCVQAGAGTAAGFPDLAYEQAGAEVVSAEDAWGADVVLRIAPPGPRPDGGHEADQLSHGAVLLCLLDPARNEPLLHRMGERAVTAVALDQVPRITRAQKMDVLSSMANIAGYRAMVEAAQHFGSFFTGQMTAAGKAPPARVLVIGAGVAGLAAIGAARGLGAEVRAFDVRSACREQVESMGASFLEVDLDESGEDAGGYAKEMSAAFIEAEMALFAAQAKQVDIIVTTALIPGRTAPTLITEEMVRSMRPGSVVVDLAAATGGNCALTVPGEVVSVHGVTIIGYTDLPSRMPTVASRFLGQNLCHLLAELGGADLAVCLTDEVHHQAVVLLDGDVRWPVPPFPKPELPEPVVAPPPPPPPAPPEEVPHEKPGVARLLSLVAAVGLTFLGLTAPGEFLQHLTVFVLACFVGWQVIWSVTPALHTPLMSVTNAISGIIILGGMLTAGSGTINPAAVLGAVAILFASINIVGGFLVTQRMLRMFHREQT